MKSAKYKKNDYIEIIAPDSSVYHAEILAINNQYKWLWVLFDHATEPSSLTFDGQPLIGSSDKIINNHLKKYKIKGN